MLVNLFRDAALRRIAGSRPRNPTARKPSWDSLEKRELLLTLVLPSSDGSTLTASYTITNVGFYPGNTAYGGDFLGTLDGTTALATYSVDLTGSVPFAGTYNAVVTTDGTTFANPVSNAGAIAWLMTNLAQKAGSADAQGALQAAIWHEEYGTTGFQLDGADNSNAPGDNDPTLITDYRDDLSELGTNTASVSSVDWISPTYQDGAGPVDGLVAVQVGQAEPLALPDTSVPYFSYTYVDPKSGETNYESASGGNFMGTLNGTTHLSATYCVTINSGISIPGSFNATVTSYGAVYGDIVPNAGAIAWLVTNLGPTATTGDQEDALQAAIWYEEYPPVNGTPNFQLDGVNNSNPEGNDATLIADYHNDLSALGTHTAPVGSVDWISPIEANEQANQDQGLVALPLVIAQTKTTVSLSVTPAAFGRTVTFSAAVTNTTGTGGTPTGSVQFQIDSANYGKPVRLSAGGTAAINDATLGVGSHKIDAVYIPTGNFTTSTSLNGPNDTQKITPDVTAVFVSSSANPTTKNKAVSLSVTVANESPQSTAIPLGTVVLTIDGKAKPAITLSSGKAVLKGLKLAAGTHTVTVLYTPMSPNFATSHGQLTGGEIVKE